MLSRRELLRGASAVALTVAAPYVPGEFSAAYDRWHACQEYERDRRWAQALFEGYIKRQFELMAATAGLPYDRVVVAWFPPARNWIDPVKED
jgi:hypothetical protein